MHKRKIVEIWQRQGVSEQSTVSKQELLITTVCNSGPDPHHEITCPFGQESRRGYRGENQTIDCLFTYEQTLLNSFSDLQETS